MDAGLAFNASTVIFALPVFNRIYSVPDPGLLAQAIVLVQLLPAVVLYLGSRFLRGRGDGPWFAYWCLGLLVAAGSVLRLGQVVWAPAMGNATKLAIAALAIAAAGFVVLARRRAVRTVAELVPVTLLVTVVFVVQTLAALPAPALSLSTGRADSVYVLVFDGLGRDVLLKDGTIDGDRFPALRALADDGVFFSDATATDGRTCLAVPTIVLGRRPDETDCRDRVLSGDPTDLFSLLAPHYRLAIYEEYFRDCVSGTSYECKGVAYLTAKDPYLALGIHYLPLSVRPDWSKQLLGGRNGLSLGLFDELLADVANRPQAGRASFIHVLLPHEPFLLDAHGVPHGSPHDDFTGLPEEQPEVYRNYAQQAMLVDRLVGQLIAVLEAKGAREDATIVVTADHGPRAPLAFSQLTPNVPLIISSPRLPPGISNVDYQHVDLIPTVLDVLQLPPSPRTDGVSAFAASRPVRTKSCAWLDGAYERNTSGVWVRRQ